MLFSFAVNTAKKSIKEKTNFIFIGSKSVASLSAVVQIVFVPFEWRGKDTWIIKFTLTEQIFLSECER